MTKNYVDSNGITQILEYLKKIHGSSLTDFNDRITALESKTDNDTIYDDSSIRELISELNSKITTLESKTDNDTIYDDTEVKNRLIALEAREDKDTIYDDSPIQSRMETIENAVSALENASAASASVRGNATTGGFATTTGYLNDSKNAIDKNKPYSTLEISADSLTATVGSAGATKTITLKDYGTEIVNLTNTVNNITNYDDTELDKRVRLLENRSLFATNNVGSNSFETTLYAANKNVPQTILQITDNNQLDITLKNAAKSSQITLRDHTSEIQELSDRVGKAAYGAREGIGIEFKQDVSYNGNEYSRTSSITYAPSEDNPYIIQLTNTTLDENKSDNTALSSQQVNNLATVEYVQQVIQNANPEIEVVSGDKDKGLIISNNRTGYPDDAYPYPIAQLRIYEAPRGIHDDKVNISLIHSDGTIQTVVPNEYITFRQQNFSGTTLLDFTSKAEATLPSQDFKGYEHGVTVDVFTWDDSFWYNMSIDGAYTNNDPSHFWKLTKTPWSGSYISILNWGEGGDLPTGETAGVQQNKLIACDDRLFYQSGLQNWNEGARLLDLGGNKDYWWEDILPKYSQVHTDHTHGNVYILYNKNKSGNDYAFNLLLEAMKKDSKINEMIMQQNEEGIDGNRFVGLNKILTAFKSSLNGIVSDISSLGSHTNSVTFVEFRSRVFGRQKAIWITNSGEVISDDTLPMLFYVYEFLQRVVFVVYAPASNMQFTSDGYVKPINYPRAIGDEPRN